MEQVLDVYERPYDPGRPVVGVDEASTQLIGETRCPVPAGPGQPARVDYEYRRNGTANLFVACEPLLGWRALHVTERRTATDFAAFLKFLADDVYAGVARITLVLDNLIGEIRPASQRNDLLPVYAFNAEGLYTGAKRAGDTKKLSRWQDLLKKMRAEGFAIGEG